MPKGALYTEEVAHVYDLLVCVVRDVLDLGCGTGYHVLPLARESYNVRGIDSSAAMLWRPPLTPSWP